MAKRKMIYLDDAIDEINKLEYPSSLVDVKRIIVDLPSAQPEIIRCKDCFMHGICRFEQWLGLDGYCSKAERRTDE